MAESKTSVRVRGEQRGPASFEPVMARYVKVAFGNVGAAIDEIEVLGAAGP